MLANLLLGLSTMIVCLLLQLMLLVYLTHYYREHDYLNRSPSLSTSMIMVNSIMLILIAAICAQVAIWALLFEALNEFERFDTAFYHSAVNFATLGYGDVVMSEEHRLLGPLQAINGVLMIGVTTAALMGAFQDSIRKTLEARKNASGSP